MRVHVAWFDYTLTSQGLPALLKHVRGAKLQRNGPLSLELRSNAFPGTTQRAIASQRGDVQYHSREPTQEQRVRALFSPLTFTNPVPLSQTTPGISSRHFVEAMSRSSVIVLRPCADQPLVCWPDQKKGIGSQYIERLVLVINLHPRSRWISDLSFPCSLILAGPGPCPLYIACHCSCNLPLLTPTNPWRT